MRQEVGEASRVYQPVQISSTETTKRSGMIIQSSESLDGGELNIQVHTGSNILNDHERAARCEHSNIHLH